MQRANRQPRMLTWPIIRKGLSYMLLGKLSIKNSHLPETNHQVPNDFCGVCVASADDAAMDNYVISQLNDLGIKQVRLDFTYGDLSSFNARFLDQLIQQSFKVTLHIVQPFKHARNMQSVAEQETWRSFLTEVLNRFGEQVARVEIGTTINRKRWAGYTMDGFLSAWGIAFDEIKKRNIALTGPNITDFEPIYNIGVLNILKAKNQLPDIHTDNLFSERVSEPERFDHRIFKYRWLATFFKVNLIKKARLLKKIGTDFGVSALMSPAAFWAIYRIKRILPAGEQKQADYAARYMLLNAASGALEQAFWGAFICHREGLINDGLQDADYPALERVAHYKNVDGKLADFVHYPSFAAFKTVARMIQGAHYQAPIATSNGLEIHHFHTAEHTLHAAWTINGKTAFLQDIYDIRTIELAELIGRDGQPMPKTSFITESPLYLRWPLNYQPQLIEKPTLAKDLAIHAHIEGLQYYPFRQDGWFGLILAKDEVEASLLAKTLHPDSLQSPQKDHALRHARNAIWAITDPRDATKTITIKQPVKMYPHKAFLDRFKPSKAKRSWNGAIELLRRGIATAHPVAFFEKIGDQSLKQNFYICDFVHTDCTVGEMFMHFATGAKEFTTKSNITIGNEEAYIQLAHYFNNMHKRGVYFRDLSGGNVLVNIDADKKLHFSLIDTARAWFFAPPIDMSYRISDMSRICNKLHAAGRERLMNLYLANIGRRFTFRYKFAFFLYDFKVELKRKIGRKGIKRLIKRIKALKSTH